jgi:hypothetical protein
LGWDFRVRKAAVQQKFYFNRARHLRPRRPGRRKGVAGPQDGRLGRGPPVNLSLRPRIALVVNPDWVCAVQ